MSEIAEVTKLTLINLQNNSPKCVSRFHWFRDGSRINLEKQKTTSLLKSQNKRQKGNVKGVKNDEFQQQIQELEIEERKEELERKKLDKPIKKIRNSMKRERIKGRAMKFNFY
ncbi:uncharacterized protein OCT59_011904 [Rhizophagus irregularis]|uniref:Uncharacterized protein n=1 Tax=Rhizophagus irregularis (strain DAOM 181602 / DAOM 197198 / MUCL 43194) TaxID=747089 RepID=A0A2P4QV56_RHIID|nr:hypothetical protein GLOIN_2v1763070 [Rhizophagus irregularis DAOM 181602=DAOM 197198]UZO00786.1 hypothetical protein OCT59_011904 [Rhizophagus irregularis]POG81507.1 hypothetical protein GLOIN_2v1763070 [Rhizophagus irregularis DAOM 181602=DAOM 197198]CAB4496376.1 unnamed protein product [Rhizophagus irregularis]CAB5187641.1 unnamed protein product [Rhizophagus irregularis]GET64537.1 hypothetical protein GLOIN_2v1763070 [Rhizophagus irregularis DAOM 181602=DAOM 197198]|eukprot:XP_025188373.1 hypothetical protein GLOIN_2v1763070 [Rhizophagus irregularis DAOM 181602=DAOM 197198]